MDNTSLVCSSHLLNLMKHFLDSNWDITLSRNRYCHLIQLMFHDLGPVYKEDLMFRPTMTVHVKDPDDFEKVFRAEGKYPRKLILDFFVGHRKRRNRWPGIIQV